MKSVCHRFGAPVRQHINNLMALHIHQKSAEFVSPTKGKIIDSKLKHRSNW